MYASQQTQNPITTWNYPGLDNGAQLPGYRFDFSLPTQEEELVPSSWPNFNVDYAAQLSELSVPPEPPAARPASSFTSDQPPTLPQCHTELNKHSRHAPGHIPRPRNSFMIYRCEFNQLPETIEHDNRHISRIIAHCWKQLPDAEKQHWRDRAVEEKLEHERKYPGYRYHPAPRGSKNTKKRNVQRNGKSDVLRCRRVAELLMKGTHGDDLENEVEKIDEDTEALAHKEFEETYEFKVNLPSLGKFDESEKVARVYGWIQDNQQYLGSEDPHSESSSPVPAGSREQEQYMAPVSAKKCSNSGAITSNEHNQPNELTSGDAVFDYSLNHFVVPSQRRRELNLPSYHDQIASGRDNSPGAFYLPAQTAVPSQQAVSIQPVYDPYQPVYSGDNTYSQQTANAHYSVDAQGYVHYYETSSTAQYSTRYNLPAASTPYQFTQPVY